MSTHSHGARERLQVLLHPEDHAATLAMLDRHGDPGSRNATARDLLNALAALLEPGTRVGDMVADVAACLGLTEVQGLGVVLAYAEHHYPDHKAAMFRASKEAVPGGEETER